MTLQAGLTFITIISVFFLALIVYLRKSSETYKYNKPSDITMLRILYMYKDAMQEPSPSERVKKLDGFEEALSDFLAAHEEKVQEEQLNRLENLISIRAYKGQ